MCKYVSQKKREIRKYFNKGTFLLYHQPVSFKNLKQSIIAIIQDQIWSRRFCQLILIYSRVHLKSKLQLIIRTITPIGFLISTCMNSAITSMQIILGVDEMNANNRNRLSLTNTLRRNSRKNCRFSLHFELVLHSNINFRKQLLAWLILI